MLLCQHAQQHAVLRKACPLLVRSQAARDAVTAGLMKQLQLLNNTDAAAAAGPDDNSAAAAAAASAEVEGSRASEQQSLVYDACVWVDLALQQALGLGGVVDTTAGAAGASNTCIASPCTETAHTCSLHKRQQQQQRVVTVDVAHLGQTQGGSSSSNRHRTVQLQELLLQQLGGHAELLLLAQQLQAQQIQLQQQQGSAGTAAAGEAGTAQLSSVLHSSTEHGSSSGSGLGVLEWIEAAQEPAAAAAAAAAAEVAGEGGEGPQFVSHASGALLAVRVLLAASSCEAAGAMTNREIEYSSDGSSWSSVVEAAAAQLPGALQQLLSTLCCEACRCRSAAAYVEAAVACLAARRAVRHAHLALHMHYKH
jgi:hypothetical protein